MATTASINVLLGGGGGWLAFAVFREGGEPEEEREWSMRELSARE